MSEQTYLVRCMDCQRDEDTPWLPLILRESCAECASHTVARHLEEHPGHRCEVVNPPKPVDRSVVRLTTRKGW